MEMRPKSIATVVPFFEPATWPAWSMPRLSTVISASVRSGSISEMDPTNVVLPTAKPPATTIFMVTGATGGRPGRLERADAIEEPLEELDVVRGAEGGRKVDGDRADRVEVADEDAHDADGEGEAPGELGDRGWRGGVLEDAHHLGRVGHGAGARA